MDPTTKMGPYRGDSTNATGRGFITELMTDPATLLKMVPTAILYPSASPSATAMADTVYSFVTPATGCATPKVAPTERYPESATPLE